MNLQKVIPAAKGGEPDPYSNGILAGNTLYPAGQTGIDAKGVADFPTYAAVRDQVLKGHKPASTLAYVSGLFKPELVEIEAIAVNDGA